jgi:hypothetical protein
MKKIFFSILVSILCVLLNATSTVKSNNIENNKGYSVSEKANSEDKSSNAVEIELNSQRPEKSDSVGLEPGITYIFKVPDINNKNYFSPENSYTLGINDKLIHVLDSTFNNDSLYGYLERFFINYERETRNEYHDYRVFQREKKLEAIAHLIWPSFLIICLFYIFTHYEEGNITDKVHYAMLLSIALLIGTIITVPDIIIMIKGIDYSVINSLGK